MKVILLKNIESLGKANEIKNVPNGYARNFLFPKNLAVLATKEAINSVEQKKKSDEVKNAKEVASAKELAEKLNGLELNLKVKVGSEGQLFESITKQKVAEKIMELGFNIDKNHIEMEDHIKQKGIFPVIIKTGHGFSSEVKLSISEE